MMDTTTNSSLLRKAVRTCSHKQVGYNSGLHLPTRHDIACLALHTTRTQRANTIKCCNRYAREASCSQWLAHRGFEGTRNHSVSSSSSSLESTKQDKQEQMIVVCPIQTAAKKTVWRFMQSPLSTQIYSHNSASVAQPLNGLEQTMAIQNSKTVAETQTQ